MEPDRPHTRAQLRDLAASLLDRVENVPASFDEPGVPPKAELPHLERMLRTALLEAGGWPLDKLGRWLGYVQGVLAARGLLDVDAERDRTRAGFRAAYEADGLPVPARADAGRGGR